MISQDQSSRSVKISQDPYHPLISFVFFGGQALKHGVFVDLRGTQLHDQTNREAQILLQENVMRNTSQRIYSRPERGYSSVVK